MLSSFHINFLENHSHNIFDDVEDGNKTNSIEIIDEKLEFHTKISKVHHNNHETIKIKMKNTIRMMYPFDLSCIDEKIEKNENKCIQALSTNFNKKKDLKDNLEHNLVPCSKGKETNKMRMWI